MLGCVCPHIRDPFACAEVLQYLVASPSRSPSSDSLREVTGTVWGSLYKIVFVASIVHNIWKFWSKFRYINKLLYPKYETPFVCWNRTVLINFGNTEEPFLRVLLPANRFTVDSHACGGQYSVPSRRGRSCAWIAGLMCSTVQHSTCTVIQYSMIRIPTYRYCMVATIQYSTTHNTFFKAYETSFWRTLFCVLYCTS